MANNINISGIKKTTTITDGDYVLIESLTLGTRLIKKKHLFSNLSDLGIKSLSSIGNTIQISSLSDYNNIEVRTTTNLGSGVTLPPTAGSVYTYTENRLASLSGSVNTNISSLRSLYNGTHLTLSGIAKIPTLTGDTYLSGGTFRISKGNGYIQRWQSSDGVDVATLDYAGNFAIGTVASIVYYLKDSGNNTRMTIDGDTDSMLLYNGGLTINSQAGGQIVSMGIAGDTQVDYTGRVTAALFTSPNISALSANLLSLSSASLNNNTTRVYGSGTAASPIASTIISTGEANKFYHISGKYMTSLSACFSVTSLATTNGSGNFTILHGESASKEFPPGGTLSLTLSAVNSSLKLVYQNGGTDRYTYFMDVIKV